MARAGGVYRRMVGARIRSELQYRTAFALFVTSQFLVTALDFVEIALIFNRIDGLAGWSLGEVAFLYGTTGVPFALADLLVSHVEMVHVRVRNGSFDSLLVRPVSPLLQLLADDFALRRLGKLLQAALILAVAAGVAGVEWTPGRVALFVVAIIAGTAIFSSFFVLGACIQFFTVDGGEVANSFTYGGNFASQFPMTVYGSWLRRFFVFIVPVAFVNYLPVLAILDRPAGDRFGLPAAAMYASPVVAVVTVGAAASLWRFSVRRYQSTGS